VVLHIYNLIPLQDIKKKLCSNKYRITAVRCMKVSTDIITSITASMIGYWKQCMSRPSKLAFYCFYRQRQKCILTSHWPIIFSTWVSLLIPTISLHKFIANITTSLIGQAVILEIMYFATFKTGILLFLSLTSQMYFDITLTNNFYYESQFVDTDNITQVRPKEKCSNYK